MTNVESVDTVLQYLSYLQLLITEITGHKNTMKMTKGQVKFTIQMVGQKKSQLDKTQNYVKSFVQSRSFLLRKI